MVIIIRENLCSDGHLLANLTLIVRSSTQQNLVCGCSLLFRGCVEAVGGRVSTINTRVVKRSGPLHNGAKVNFTDFYEPCLV